MAPNPPTVTLGFPHDPVKVAKEKAKTLDGLLSSRVRAWHGYFAGLSLAYIDAHAQHTTTLTAIKEQLRNQAQFLQTIVLGVLIPSMVGGGVAALVADKGAAIIKPLLAVATKRKAALLTFATKGGSTVIGDSIKQELKNEMTGLLPQPGSEWNAVGDSPIKFFVQLQKMVDDYATDVTFSVESAAKRGNLDEFTNLVNAHLLSPFIQDAPMDTHRLVSSKDLTPIFEIFLWVYWARLRDVKYWTKQISLAAEPDDRSLVGKIWDAAWHDDDTEKRAWAEGAVETLDPILARLLNCGIKETEITQFEGGSKSDRQFLDILKVKTLGTKHRGTLLGDLVANLDSKSPTSALDGKPVDKDRALK